MSEPRRSYIAPKDADAEPVCLLDLDKEMLKQRAESPEAFFAAAQSQETLSNGAEFRFEAAPGMWERIETFVAEERECCPFFAFEQWEEDSAVVLRITKPGATPT